MFIRASSAVGRIQDVIRLFAFFVAGMMAAPSGQRAFCVAHRGASAYAPEHTAAAYRLAIAQGAEYVEQDLTPSKDGVLICSHDGSLERVTNVKEVFPDRFTEVEAGGRKVRRWWVEDFTVAELKRLDAGSWFGAKYKGERVLTFAEAVAIVKGKAGFFPELKMPGRLRAKGIELEPMVARALREAGLVDAAGRATEWHGRPAVHLQIFEEDSLRRMAKLLPAVPRSFLIGAPDQAARWLTPAGLREVKTFATGIAPHTAIVEARPGLMAEAHAAGLTVVPYTFLLRPKAATYPDLPPAMQQQIAKMYAALPAEPGALTAAMRKFVETYQVDGLFTDNPDLFPR